MKSTFFCCCWLAILFAAQATMNAQTEVPSIEKKTTEDNIVVLVSVPAQSIAGCPVNLTIKFENQGKKDVPISTSPFRDFDLELLDVKGKAVPFTRFGQQVHENPKPKDPRKEFTLAPGKSMEFTLNVARLFDLSYIGRYKLNFRWKQKSPTGGKTTGVKIENLTFRILSDTPGGL